MKDTISILFTFDSTLGSPAKEIILDIPACDWEQAQRLDYESRCDYIYRVCHYELMRPFVRRMDVKVLA